MNKLELAERMNLQYDVCIQKVQKAIDTKWEERDRMTKFHHLVASCNRTNGLNSILPETREKATLLENKIQELYEQLNCSNEIS